MDVLLVNFRCGYMEFVLQLRDEAFDDHSLFFQAVHPRGV
jgi:hypothetical protein